MEHAPSPATLMRPFLTRPVAHTHAARRQERAVAREVKGRRQKGSGNKPGHRGDVLTPLMAGEVKHTVAQSMMLRRAVLRKIEREALAMSRVPWLLVDFRDAAEKPGDQWALVPWWWAREWLK